MRKSYGTTYWGLQFLNALNNIDYSNRLPRGKTYANKGTVSKIEINKERIDSHVQGSRRTPYKVKFEFPTFTPKQKAQILELVTDNPAYLSKLLNRELPDALNNACKNLDIHIFPNSWKDLEGSCSCPDWAVPCKHMAATLYIIANEIDKNPFLVFDLHDFDLFKGLEGIGYTATGQKDIHIPFIEKVWQEVEIIEDSFEWQEEVFETLDFTLIPNCKEQLLTILTPQPVFFPSGDFHKILGKAYTSISKVLLKKEKRDIPDQLTLEMQNIEDVELFIDTEFDFLDCTLRNAKGKAVLNFKNLEKFIDWLESIPNGRLNLLSPSIRGFFLVNLLANKLAIKSAAIPQLMRVSSKHYIIRWLPALMNETVKDICEKVEQLTPRNLLFFKNNKEIKQPQPDEYFNSLLSLFLSHYVNESNNSDYKIQNTDIGRLFFNGSLEHFKEFETKEYPKTIQLWLNRFYITERDYVPVLIVEDLDGLFEVKVAIEDKKKAIEPISLSDLFSKNKHNHIRLEIIRSLSMLSDYFPEINDLLASKGKKILRFDSDEFVEVLFKILPTIELFGIKILLPKALRKMLRPQMSVGMDVGDDGTVAPTSIISLEAMLRFKWQVAIGDKQMSIEEFKEMVKKYSGIVKIKDQYVFFDEKEIKKLIEQLEDPPELNGHQLLQTALTEDYNGARVQLSERLQSLLYDLMNGEEVAVPKGLRATLRPYQLRGYRWLYKNTRLGFGSLIADDMGLGKTLQIIATLLRLKEDGEFENQKGLIIVPTTLLTNWDKEIKKFAPHLKAHIYHGSNRKLEPLENADVLITTYGVARSEAAIAKKKWLCVIIDEAQNIKNPSTAQTKAIKKIKAPVKIAMSGTPVENRLSEYWSIFDFSNKGYLNNLKKFKENFAKPIEIDRDQKQLDKFRKITEPFILRRLKTDKSIIKDLPDKIEKDQYCDLTKDQAALYQNVIDNVMKDINSADGINRKGLILKLITALKQICNHPAQFLKKGLVEPAFSGKAMLLMDLMEEILNNGEKVLIFTQYQEMGKHIATMLQKQFGLEAQFLHGGVSRKKRDEMVDDFQENRSTKALILSLKAGGTGLNLTAASNVIHYDLWWNPATEAQATDRAYRIGQKNKVLVHRFITQGTFEEKINKLLIKKKDLANLTVSTGEKWIGDMSNDELREMVKLG